MIKRFFAHHAVGDYYCQQRVLEDLSFTVDYSYEYYVHICAYWSVKPIDKLNFIYS